MIHSPVTKKGMAQARQRWIVQTGHWQLYDHTGEGPGCAAEAHRAAIHLESLPGTYQVQLERQWHGTIIDDTIDPAHLARIERDFEAAAADPRERIV